MTPPPILSPPQADRHSTVYMDLHAHMYMHIQANVNDGATSTIKQSRQWGIDNRTNREYRTKIMVKWGKGSQANAPVLYINMCQSF